jgi:hypothetical protein
MKSRNSEKSNWLGAVLLLAFSISSISIVTGCNNNTKAQENEIAFSETYSGSFAPASIVTDSNDDGKPANLGDFEGTSTFGSVIIQSLNEFEATDPNENCPNGQIESKLVRGNFVKRFESGELIFGTWDSGTSCFDPVTNLATTSQIGTFSGGTGQFENASGPIEIDFSSSFLAVPSQDGFGFGGTTGTGQGTIILNGN